MKLHYGDMTDSSCLVKIIVQVRPNEIYNLAAQSHVKVCTTHKGCYYIPLRNMLLDFFLKLTTRCPLI